MLATLLVIHVYTLSILSSHIILVKLCDLLIIPMNMKVITSPNARNQDRVEDNHLNAHGMIL